MHTTPITREELSFLGARARILLDGDDTDGTVGIVDMLEVPAGHMPPLHVHHDADEGFHVIDGELTLYLPGRELMLRSGDFFLAPRGVAHTYRVGGAPAHVVTLSRPAGFERFVRTVAELPVVDPAALTEAAAEQGIEILGPPGALPNG
jgi:quercetin dioxygenase-like cupin family protein